jgi:Asp-tRNA(Asn)/Glu-tRNA(Gln) amidotransferase A subunit family amidase
MATVLAISHNWSATGMPVSSGLPLGLQLTAAPGQDARVLRAAVSLQQLLRA